MTSLKTGSLDLPNSILDPWMGKIGAGSTIASLSSAIPMKFGVGQSFSFDIGEAELVGEGAQKGSSTAVPTKITTRPLKFVKTVRFSNEVLWADEDYQTEVVAQILALIQPALSRALDFAVIHGVNPATGAAAASITSKLIDSDNEVVIGSQKAAELLDAADVLVLADGYVPTGIALDPELAGKFSTARITGGAKQFPNFGYGTDVTDLDGHRASTSRTVGAKGVVADSTLRGLVGDFDAVRWGIQRQLGLEMIEHGDPDGLGDLKRVNEVAFRAEVVYGVGIADVDAFAKLVTEATV